jgi:hypothetical protein
MELALPLDQMTPAEKLRVQEGSSHLVDWAEARQKIRDLTKY